MTCGRFPPTADSRHVLTFVRRPLATNTLTAHYKTFLYIFFKSLIFFSLFSLFKSSLQPTTVQAARPHGVVTSGRTPRCTVINVCTVSQDSPLSTSGILRKPPLDEYFIKLLVVKDLVKFF